MGCKWQYGDKPWIFEEGFIKQKGTDLVLGTIGQGNVVTIQKLETDNSLQKWTKRDINWDEDGDEIDYQLVQEESGKFLTARESSITVENKGRVTFIFSFKIFCYKFKVQMLKASNVENMILNDIFFFDSSHEV